MDNFETLMGGAFSSGKSGKVYTDEEINAAKKRQKKTGGTLLENLEAVTGRTLKTDFDLDRELDELNRNLANDFGRLSKENEALAGKIGAKSELGPKEPTMKEIGPEALDGAEEAVKEVVFGQDAFLKKLLIAFKRPYVLPPEKGHAKNSMFLTGREDTGKHTALKETVKELAKRGVLKSDTVKFMDLSLYPNPGADKVFLQDLYEALSSGSDVIAFEKFENCHISYLSYLSGLVMTGVCRLAERYTLQNGQLVSVSNAFASKAVGEFSAAGKYLVFLSVRGVDQLANQLGAPFVNHLGDICRTEEMEEESYRKVSKVELKKLKEQAAKNLKFELSGEAAPVVEAGVRMSDRGAGVTGILAFYKDLMKSLATLRLEKAYPAGTAVELTVEENRVMAAVGAEKIDLIGQLPIGYAGELEDVKAELDRIVGLEKIKQYIFGLEEYYAAQKRRREQGLKTSEVSKHMIFTGSPGTGKTTIARIISRYLKAIGVLSGGQLVEVTRADLVGRYVGHTAPLTKQVLESAIGGVLFIDEAYSLYRGKDDSFGLEAIDTLVKGIEDNRDNLIVILAGYSKEMSEFLTSNSGLESRFPNVIEFPDYTGEEMTEIAKIQAKSKGYRIDEGALENLLLYFSAVQEVRSATAGNGRLVRNKIEEAILNQSRRIVAEPDADLELLTSRDFDLSDIYG